jgi:signal transduction histidine kinase/ligand-binding sensor domain-containing protein/AraC-like DNA-binding protein
MSAHIKNTSYELKNLLAILIFFPCLPIFCSPSTSFQNGFKHLSVEKGLSESSVLCIYKDKKDFMWFGTRKGLNRYDGISFKYFFQDPNNPNSISSNFIQNIIGDKYTNLIIITDRDINYYNRFTDKFSIIPSDYRIWNLVSDNNGQIWGTCDRGLVKYSYRNKRFEIIHKTKLFQNLFDLIFDGNNSLWITNPNGVLRLNITSQEYKFYPLTLGKKGLTGDFYIEQLKNKEIWVCVDNDLYKYHADKNCFIDYPTDSNLKNTLISCFNAGTGDDLLIGTDGKGLLKLNSKTNQWDSYNHAPDNSNSLSGNTIYSIYADNEMGIIWLGLYMGGIDYNSNYSSGFEFLFHRSNSNNGLINNNIRCLLTDKIQNIWIGTRQGVTVYDPIRKTSINIDERILLNNGLSNSIITKLWEDKQGCIWICAYKGGVIVYNPQKKTFSKPETHYPNFKLPANIGIFDFLMDRNNNLWVGTSKGTYIFPKNKEGFKFNDDFTKCIIENRLGYIYLGTSYSGLNCINTSSMSVIKTPISSLLTSQESKRINSLYEDSKGNIWIGTGGKGIICYNPINNTYTEYSENKGLKDNYIAAITEDKQNNIWVTTYSGLVKFNPIKKTFKNFYLEEDVTRKEFNPQSLTKAEGGQIFAGSTNGLISFNPAHCKENIIVPQLIFTDIFINSVKIDPSGNTFLDTAIGYKKTITLNYKQNAVGLEFTAPAYYFVSKINFYYQIDELSTGWISLGTRRFIDFFRLKPGKYTIRVKAENSDGYCSSSGTTIQLIIKQPLWKSNVALILYFIAILIIIWGIRKIIKIRLLLKYQIFIEKTEKTKQKEINQTRLKFFSDVSHELGNFITLISLPVELLGKMEEDDTKKYYIGLINKHTKKLQLLINRITNLRKVETGKLKLKTEEDNIIFFIQSICENFKPLFSSKNIHFTEYYPNKPIITWFDKEKLEQVIYNLLSNAFKYTPANGQISISVSKKTGTIHLSNKKLVEIQIFNSGSEINPENTSDIFDRYHSNKEGSPSSGMGLYLTKQYLSIHKGEISYESLTGKGVTFIIKLPFGETYLSDDEKSSTNQQYELETIQYIEGEQELPNNTANNRISRLNGKPQILYIEKNSDLRKLITENLADYYCFIESDTISDGILKAKNYQPAVILYDINLANSDNLEFCRLIKSNPETSHIPLIIITLKESIDEQIEGFKAGVDAYISRPLSLEFLVLVVNNQLDLQKKINEAFNHSANLPNPNDLSTFDQRFLKRAYKTIEDNINNKNLGVPDFIRTMGTSKYMLYNKLSILTGLTPNEFIINYRLKKAALILKNGKLKDADIYENLGFNDISYFRKCFKKQFGVTPSQFIRSESLENG